MSFFTNPDILIGEKILEIVYILTGFISIYTGIKNAFDKENPSNIGTGIFWIILGIVLSFGRWIPAILGKVKIGKINEPSEEEMNDAFNKIGMKIFIPALSIGFCAIVFAKTSMGALVGVGIGVIVAMIILMIFSRKNKLITFFNDSERYLSTVGPLSMLPMLLASLGAVFTAAGVGDVIANLVGVIIPHGNVTMGIIIYAIGMMLFTMIMGNAFAAITVMTVGIGAPFVLSNGADPVLIGMLALTCGYCGTLLTPMAANFNIVPVAILDMKDRMGVIKNQVVPAIFLLIFQIIYMIVFK